jgi:phosphoribosylamine--glycine ligase
VVVPRLKTDLVELFLAVANEKLDEITLKLMRSATTVMVSGGYPEDYEKEK